ncbi:fimbrial biogenesis usher protein [Salmonella enterica]|nr:fimbrial biogenesis outer membrane usher protein [Salmonella enterica subsp. enterica]EIX6433174.1 fimbrial biogenesis usher protein [Salmonella enterica]
MDGLNTLPACIKVALYGLLITFTMSTTAHAREVDFDTDILKSRGISKNIARYFSNAPKFLPGHHSVKVSVNGLDKGTIAVRFGDEGQLCVDDDFIAAAGLRPLTIASDEKCHNILTDYPDTIVNPLPGNESLELFVPPQALDNLLFSARNFQHGGTAGLFNYELFTSRNEYDGSQTSTYSQATLEGGLNVNDWALRSRHILTDNDGERNVDNLYTYAERVFLEQKIRLQVGQINVDSSLFAGPSIDGIQFVPEQALSGEPSGVSVSGIAHTGQARVEIRQSGQIIQTSLVNAGPFTLENVPVLQSNKDLDVNVYETDGTLTHFTVPAASLNVNRSARPGGLSMSAGRVRNVSSDYDAPWIYHISDGWRWSPAVTAQASGMLGENYQALGAGLHGFITDEWQLSPRLLISQDTFDTSRHGMKGELQSNVRISDRFDFTMSAAHYFDDYRELTEAMDEDFESEQNSWSGNLSWHDDLAGTFSLGYNYTQGADGSEDSRYILASWSKYYKYASVTVNWQHAVNTDDDNHDNRNDSWQDDDMLYVNVNIPFGTQSVSLYTRNQGNRTNYGIQSNGPISNDVNYTVSADRDTQDDESSLNGNIAANLHYTKLSVGGGATGSDQRNYNATLSGGIAAHSHGLTFSPETIRDTFGIIRLSEPESGVQISTPQGPVWTDRWGQAVIPSLTEWNRSRIEINTNTLQQNVDLANGIKTVSAAHGSVSNLDFKVLTTRRVMLSVKRADGTWLPKGMSIVDEKGNYQVSVVDNGRVFILDATDSPALYGIDDNMQRLCQIHYTLNAVQDKENFYESAEGVCK